MALPLLLYLPGWALSRLSDFSPDLIERHYERLAISALWSGWLALLLAELGVFSLWLHLAITLAASALLVILRHDSGRWTIAALWKQPAVERAIHPPPSSVFRPPSPWLWPAAYAAVALLGLLLVARPFEVVLGVRDAGVYANAGFAIARTGSLVQHDALLANLGQAALSTDPALREPAAQSLTNFLISQPRDRYIATKLRAAGFLVNEGDAALGRVVPQGLHLLPAWIGLLTSAGGRELGLFAPGLLGWLGLLSVGMLGRRLGGPWVGLLAMLFLTLNGVQVWFSRYSTAETTAQFLIWCGLYFFAKAIDDGRWTVDGGGPPDQPAGAQMIDHRLPSTVYRLLAGIALGQVAFARLDFFLLAPLLLYLGYLWFTRRWGRADTFLALGLGLMLIHAGLHMLFIARAYVLDTGFARFQDSALLSLLLLPLLTPPLREAYLTSKFSTLDNPLRLAIEIAALGLALGGMVFLRYRSLRLADRSPLRVAERWLGGRRELLTRLMMIGVLLLAGYAYLVRPEIIDDDMLFNTRGGWSDPLTRDPAMVQADVRSGRMSPAEARLMAGVALSAAPFWRAEVDLAATAALRPQLAVERGPWQGPLSNQTLNWLAIQGYVGAPIHLTTKLWYNEYETMSWWQQLTVDPATLSSEPAPENDKYRIPLANFVRVGWYLSPLGLGLGVVGYALWWRRGLSRASWLFLVIALVGTIYYVRQTFGTSDQTYIYILRRYLPITYPALCLGMAYALAAIGRWTVDSTRVRQPSTIRRLPSLIALSLTAIQLLFLAYTNRPIFAHTEYAGALSQLEAAAAQFQPGRDVLLLRGGGPSYSQYRDVPDMIATPLRFAFGLDAFTVKSSQPGEYAPQLAAQVRRWQAEGRTVYTLLSASGGSFALPGFSLAPAGSFMIDLAEFEALTDQKPRNVSRLTLPFAIYRLDPLDQPTLASLPLPLAPSDFAAQVSGFHRPEAAKDGTPYAWTNGAGLLRIAWGEESQPIEITLRLAGGERPAQLGPARLCVAARPEAQPWPAGDGSLTALGCFALAETLADYRVRLDPAQLPPTPGGSLLISLESESWVPAAEDPRQRDQRAVGVQFGGVR